MKSDPYLRLEEPLLIVISGPSGVGKDTILQHLKKRRVPFHFVVTAASRPARPGEVNGTDYHFVSAAEFTRMIEDDELLEYALVYGEYKGVPIDQVRQAFSSGKDVIMRLDVQGAARIRQLAPEAVLVFIVAGSEEELVQRLRARRTEKPDAINTRVATARQELQRIGEFDYCVVNPQGNVDAAVDGILAIINAEHARVHQRQVRL
ncbi:MAG: guanylate kinase [Anaerolineales bacterium]|jgi:guanylate kinase|nr:guanylate kinase [Anaerolineales bacterium]